MSLNKVYETGFRHAVEMIKRNGGREEGDKLMIQYQEPQTVPLEIAFEGLFPIERKRLKGPLSQNNSEISFEMEGCGFVVTGQAAKDNQMSDITLELDVFVDGQFLETVKIPTHWRIRRLDLAWHYDLPEGSHKITLRAKKIPDGYRIETDDVLLYSTVEPGIHVYF
jgi:hypothetical protein